MRIILLNQFYPPDVAATGQLLADVAAELARRGHDVHVICSRGAYGGGPADHGSRAAADGAAVHRVAACGFGRGNLLGRMADYVSFYALAAWRAIALGRMDVCLCLTTPPLIGLVGLVLSLLRGTRLVLWTMDLYPEVAIAYGYLKPGRPLGRLMAWLSRRLYRSASRVIALGEVMAQKLAEAGADPARIQTIHNWVPGEVVSPMPPEESKARQNWNKDGRVTLMYSGNLGIGHDLDTVLHAANRLGGAELRVLFVGEGKMRGHLSGLAAELGLDNVDFHPPQPLAALGDSLAAGDIHLISQRAGTEGLIVPSKLYGIMAAGRPVVFIGPKDCEVARIIHRSGCGLIVPPGDCQAAAEALKKLIASGELRSQMGRRGCEFYTAHFALRRGAAAVVQVVENARVPE